MKFHRSSHTSFNFNTRKSCVYLNLSIIILRYFAKTLMTFLGTFILWCDVAPTIPTVSSSRYHNATPCWILSHVHFTLCSVTTAVDQLFAFRWANASTCSVAHHSQARTCPLIESTLALMYFLTAAMLVARFLPPDRITARLNLTASPFCRKSFLSARLVIPYGYTSGCSSSGQNTC